MCVLSHPLDAALPSPRPLWSALLARATRSYDSGAVHLALLLLGVPHATYSIVGRENARDVDVMRERIEFARRLTNERAALERRRARSGGGGGDDDGGDAPALHADSTAAGAEGVGAGAASPPFDLLAPSIGDLQRVWKFLNSRCEPYTYRMPHYTDPKLVAPGFVVGALRRIEEQDMLRKDPACWGVAHICSLARQRGQSVLLSGGGADETMSDYGFNGRRISFASQWGGYWPNDTALEALFPWGSFTGGTQRNYLTKDEYTSRPATESIRDPVPHAHPRRSTLSCSKRITPSTRSYI